MTDQCRWNSRGPGDRKHQLDKVRRPLGALDLGAFEFSPFAAWQGEQFGEDAENELVSGAAADPDGDGLINLLEYAFVLDPQVASPGGLPRAARFEHAGDDYLAMEFRRPPAPTGLIYTTRVTESLKNGGQEVSMRISSHRPPRHSARTPATTPGPGCASTNRPATNRVASSRWKFVGNDASRWAAVA